MLPEEELTPGLQEPVEIPSLLFWVRDRALPTRCALPKAIHFRLHGRQRRNERVKRGTNQHLHTDNTVYAPLRNAVPRKGLAILDATGHERVLAVLPQRRLPQAVVEGRRKGRVGLHAEDVVDARGVEPVQLGACAGPEVQHCAVSCGNEGGDGGGGLEGYEVVACVRGCQWEVMGFPCSKLLERTSEACVN